jgi:hypothetical protein
LAEVDAPQAFRRIRDSSKPRQQVPAGNHQNAVHPFDTRNFNGE